MTNDDFWLWFQQNEKSLRSSPKKAAERIASALKKYDYRLGVEVSDDDEINWEVIVTAGGDPNAFQSTVTLVRKAPSVRGWKFISLKPPLGFDFMITTDKFNVDASKLLWESLGSSQKPKALGIRIYAPFEGTMPKGLEELIHKIVQTGIGERAAAEVKHIEVMSKSLADEDALSISQLGDYIEWHKQHVGDT